VSVFRTSPEPFTNGAASITEDIAVIGDLWTPIYYQWLLLVLMIIFIGLMIWLLPILGRAIKNIFETLQKMFKPNRDSTLPEA